MKNILKLFSTILVIINISYGCSNTPKKDIDAPYIDKYLKINQGDTLDEVDTYFDGFGILQFSLPYGKDIYTLISYPFKIKDQRIWVLFKNNLFFNFVDYTPPKMDEKVGPDGVIVVTGVSSWPISDETRIIRTINAAKKRFSKSYYREKWQNVLDHSVSEKNEINYGLLFPIILASPVLGPSSVAALAKNQEETSRLDGLFKKYDAKKIYVGMNTDIVNSILGYPILSERLNQDKVVYYYGEKSAIQLHDNDNSDRGYPLVAIISKDNKVEKIFSSQFFDKKWILH